MTEQTTTACATAFLRGWVRNWGLPARISSDNASTFTSRLWADIQQRLGVIVDYAPTYAPWAVRTVERQHRDLKAALRAQLLEMGDRHQEKWMQMLPWTLLARRTAYHAELQATPAEVVMGENPRLPGDLSPNQPADASLADLLTRVKTNARRPPAATRAPQKPAAMPASAEAANHVYVRRAKVTPLSPRADGPYPILERLGKSRLMVKTGEFVSGNPKTEVVHWRNCTPLDLPSSATPGERPKLGRPKKQQTT